MKKPARHIILFILSAFFLTLALPLTPLVSKKSVIVNAQEKAEKKAAPKGGVRKRRPLKKKTEKKDTETKEHVIGEGSGSKKLEEQEATSSKIDAVLIVDSSRSMQRTDPQRLRDQGAKLFTRFLSEGDRLAIVQFDQEAKVVLPFTDIAPDKLNQIDTALTLIPNEGNFTDIEAGVAQAFKLIQETGRSDAEKAVVLISDGKMDPHPERGTGAALTDVLMHQDVEAFKRMRTPIYTLAFSEEADQALLANLAQASGGDHWFTPNVDQIHLKFSDLFLTLKKPQVLSLESGGFEIDNGISEATFFITRKNVSEDVALLDPRGQLIKNDNFPANVHWHKAELYDIITIRGPLPGHWNLQGIENAGGFATLLTNLKLQVRWPETHLRVGDQVAVYVRLTEGEDVLSTPGIEGVTFYTYKILKDDGQVVGSGNLNDEGKDGDERAGDLIYSTHIKVNEVGEYKALVAVTAATFTRQQQIPFSVTKGPIVLSLLPPDSFTGAPERAEISLAEENRRLKSLKVEIYAKSAGSKSSYTVKLKADPEREGIYMLINPAIPAGEYQIYARFSGKDSKGQLVQGASETVKFNATGSAEAVDADDESGIGLGWGLAFVLFSCAWSGLVGFLFIRNFTVGKSTEDKLESYVVPAALEERLVQVRQKSSKQKREPNLEDVKLFVLVKEVFPKQLVKQLGKVAEQSSLEDSEVEAEVTDAVEEPEASEVEEQIAEPETADESSEEPAADKDEEE